MTLIIDPTTEKGKTQVETISWCQDQFNEILSQFFHDKYRIQKGLRLNFLLPKSGRGERVKVEVNELAPETEERYQFAIKEAKKSLVLRKEDPKDKSLSAEITDKKIVK